MGDGGDIISGEDGGKDSKQTKANHNGSTGENTAKRPV